MRMYATRGAFRAYFVIFSFILFTWWLDLRDPIGNLLPQVIEDGLINAAQFCLFITALGILLLYLPYIEKEYTQKTRSWFLMSGICLTWSGTTHGTGWLITQWIATSPVLAAPPSNVPFSGRIIWLSLLLIGGTIHISAGLRYWIHPAVTVAFWLTLMAIASSFVLWVQIVLTGSWY